MAGANQGDAPANEQSSDPYAVIRPKWGRSVARVSAVLVFLLFALSAVFIPGAEMQKDDWGWPDRLMLVALGALMAWFLWRFATIAATPSPEGLRVRNFLLTRTLTWSQIVRVQFGGGAPWASLDLDDTETLAVMAIQKADGAYGKAQARRLAALIHVHSDAEEPPH